MRVSQSERRISLEVTHVPCNIKYCPCLKLNYDNHGISTCFLATTSPFLTHGCCYVLRSSIQVSLCDHSHIPTALTLTRLFARCVKIYHQAHKQNKYRYALFAVYASSTPYSRKRHGDGKRTAESKKVEPRFSSCNSALLRWLVRSCKGRQAPLA